METKVWTEIEDYNPPDKTEVLLAGYAYNDKRRGYWYRVGYYERGMYFDNDDLDPWEGWPPVFWTNLPSPPNAANGPQVAEGGYTQTLKRSTDMEEQNDIPNKEQSSRLQQPVVRQRGVRLLGCKCGGELLWETMAGVIRVKREDGYHAECSKCREHFVFPVA